MHLICRKSWNFQLFVKIIIKYKNNIFYSSSIPIQKALTKKRYKSKFQKLVREHISKLRQGNGLKSLS